MTFERTTTWLGAACLLLLTTTGCAEDVDEVPETSTSTSGDSGATASSSSDPTTEAAASEDEPDDDGDPACDPACGPEQMCVGGVCFDREGGDDTSGDGGDPPAGDDSTGEPPPDEDGTGDEQPAACELPQNASFPSPECEQCLTSSCCDQLQGCYGDGSTMMPTECAQLDQCIRTECAGVTGVMAINECASMNCADLTGATGMLVPVRLCTNMNCQEQCS